MSNNTTQLTANEPINPIPFGWAKELIHRLHLMYGNKFANAWSTVDPVEMTNFWAKELAGFSPEEISRGLTACKTRVFPPTLPEFMLLCRPQINPEEAFYVAVSGMQERKRGNVGEWLHPAVFWAAAKLGEHDMLNRSYSELKTRWESALTQTLEQTTWRDIPAPVNSLPAPGDNQTAMTDAIKRLDEIKPTVIGSNVVDHKAWARRILANPKNRSIAAVRLAERALGVTVDGVVA